LTRRGEVAENQAEAEAEAEAEARQSENHVNVLYSILEATHTPNIKACIKKRCFIHEVLS